MAADGLIHTLPFEHQAKIICTKFGIRDTKLSIKYSIAGAADRSRYIHVSEEAYRRLERESPHLLSADGVAHLGSYAQWNIRIEHMIPTEVVYKYLESLHREGRLDEGKVAAFIKEKMYCALITFEEDAVLSRINLKSKMPVGWDIEKDDMLARYKKAGIKMHGLG